MDPLEIDPNPEGDPDCHVKHGVQIDLGHGSTSPQHVEVEPEPEHRRSGGENQTTHDRTPSARTTKARTKRGQVGRATAALSSLSAAPATAWRATLAFNFISDAS